MPVPVARSPRLPWLDVPPRVRNAVAECLGSPVVRADTRMGGFSPGAAVRVVCADGRRGFVKAVGAALNPDTPQLNRREIAALPLVPDHVPHARLLGSYDDGAWVALVLADVPGDAPDLPWSSEDVAAVTHTLSILARTVADPVLPALSDVALALTAWDDVAGDPAGIDPHLLASLPEMLDHQARAQDVTRGDALVSWDNVLLCDGDAVLVDWAWACRGAPWLDTLLLAGDLRIQGGPDADAYLIDAEATRPPRHGGLHGGRLVRPGKATGPAGPADHPPVAGSLRRRRPRLVRRGTAVAVTPPFWATTDLLATLTRRSAPAVARGMRSPTRP